MLKPSPGVAYLSAAVLSFLTTGLFDCFGCSRFSTGLSIGSLLFGIGPYAEKPQGRQQPSDAFGIHDERPHVVLRVRVWFKVGHIVAHPTLRRLVPPNLLPRRIPRLAGWIAGCAVVQSAAICRPAPCPVLVNALARWVFRAATCQLVSRLGPTPGINPDSAGRCAVVFQPRES